MRNSTREGIALVAIGIIAMPAIIDYQRSLAEESHQLNFGLFGILLAAGTVIYGIIRIIRD